MAVPHLVAVDVPLAAGDVALTYTAPEPLAAGTSVLVPLRARVAPGYVLGPTEERERRPLRPVITALPNVPPLPADVVALAQWMARRYLCSVGEALAMMLPGALMRDLRVHVTVREDHAAARALNRWRGRALSPETLRRAVGRGAAGALTEWAAEGVIRLTAALPRPSAPASPPGRRSRLRLHPSLWPSSAGPRSILLIGKARDGPYLAAIAETLRSGRQALCVFASVADGERFAARTRETLAEAVATWHGALPEGARAASWLAVYAGQINVVVGTRGAVFAPLPRLGLIVVDDEAAVGHREERVPRYHVREVARRRAEGVDVLLADQVPTAEAYALRARPGTQVVRLSEGGARVVVIDLRRARGAPAAPLIMPPLEAALALTHREGKRSLLFVARKGYADFLACDECGFAPRCERCNVTLAYDGRERTLRCRYCRDRFAAPSVCARCGGATLAPRGVGTQRVAQEVRRRLRAPVHVLDTDTAPTPARAAGVVRRFQADGGVLVATPLLFESTLPAIELAAVIVADASLHHPDYRAPHQGLRTFVMVRMMARSRCMVQTYTPDHPALMALRRSNLELFYRHDLAARRAFHYPPFGELVTVEVAGRASAVHGAASALAEVAMRAGAEVLGPAPLLGGRRWQVVLKAPGSVPRDELIEWTRTALPSGVRIAAEVEP